ncbi:hypothetical protein A7D27_00555 [Pseudomonas sp. 1D4]|uniref:hypothetical protein n=1 Tax=Pseudomonas sp. 1D4 TaxID=1843691 RepID=UPI00084A6D56|nr:hypothetical protein [Pseudomonas sp. 1D4]OEC47450.1 hypothetical protein A7D27_00555 [Pseudomonas sp. 1D4]
MHPTAIELGELSESLQTELAHFELDRHAYSDLQKRFSAIIEEDQKLKEKAVSLEKQADATDKAWKRMATQPDAYQASINEEINRSEQLRKEAAELRQTADARSHLKDSLLLPLAEQRMSLNGRPAAINRQYRQALLAKVLEQEGLRDTLLKAYALSRDIYLSGVEELEPVFAARCDGQHERQRMTGQGIQKAFFEALETLLAGAEQHAKSPLLATMPPLVAQEVEVTSPAGLQKLRRLHKAV